MTTPHPSSTHRSRATLATVALTAVVIALAYGLHFFSGQWLAASWQEQLATVPEEQIPILIDRIAQMGEAGFPVLVQAFDSPRESVAEAARRRLCEEIDRWQGLRTRVASYKAVCLAQALADRTPSLSPDGLRRAVDIAARILDWPVDDEIVRTGRVMASCERVIRLSGLPRPLWSARSASGQMRPSERDEPALESARRSTIDSGGQDDAVKQLTYLSGGGLPIRSSLGSDVDDAAGGQSPAKSSGRPAGDAEKAAKQAVAEEPKLAGRPDASEPARLATAGSRPLPNAAAPAGSESAGRGVSPQSRDGAVTKELLLTDTMELMRRLRQENAAEADSARQELQRRGFTEVHMELAKQMFDPDPEIRRQLARMLPELRSVNTTPWLMWLCRDRDAEVRLLAITVLATSNDPVVLAQVERIARADGDSRIQDQALRLARHRGEDQPRRMR